MATPATPAAAAPSSFYQNLPVGGDAMAGAPGNGGKKKSDADADVEKGLTGIIKTLLKLAETKVELKGEFDKMKESAKKILAKVGGDPAAAEGETPAAKPPEPAPPEPAPAVGGGVPPSQKDETHAA